MKICPGGRAAGSPLRVISRLKVPSKGHEDLDGSAQAIRLCHQEITDPAILPGEHPAFKIKSVRNSYSDWRRPTAGGRAFGSRRLIQVVLILRDIFRPISGSRGPWRRPGLKILAEIGLQEENGRRRQGALGREPARGRRFNGQVLVTPRGRAAGQLPAGIPEVIGRLP